MTLTAGDRLGPYEILGPIGKGGMGEVWKACDTRLNRLVAIKQISGEHSARFEQEARAIAALNHPHICQIYDIGPDYLVLEYLDGTPLKGPMEAAAARRLALEIACALEAAHKRGILHRDLKPANVLVTESGVKLLDFGLAKLAANRDEYVTATAAGTVLGTAAYMSPEQAQGKPLDERSDVFSFGAVLYEMLSGRRAFSGGSFLDTLNAVVHEQPTPLESPMASIVKRCMEKQPSRRFQSMTDVRGVLEQGVAAKQVERMPSIAVLPFADMSEGKDQEYFSDGLAEEIINALVKVPGLKVIARTSAFAFKGQNVDVRKIGEALGVAHILEGSVRRSGNRIRVTAQLITAADGSHLWSERYDREMEDVFAVQDEIGAAIVAVLQVKLSPEAPAKPRYTPALPAYEALLKARYFHWKVTAESMERAREFYELAISLDPQYAFAQALYADYLFGRTTVGMTPLREAAPVSRAMAQRALELDPSVAEAHATLGTLAATYDYNWKEAERQLTLATASDAASPHCYFQYALYYLLAIGRREEAVEWAQKAVHGDPLQLTGRNFAGIALAAAGRDVEAEENFRQVIHLDPGFFWAHHFLAEYFVARGRFAEALRCEESAFSLAPWYAPIVGLYAGLLIRAGRMDEGEKLVRNLRPGEAYGASAGVALFHTCQGQLDLAADWFEKAIEERNSLVVLVLQSAIGEQLRASPRWPKLASLMNLPKARTHR
jgi:serine/threonine-protein kinase